MTKPVVLALVAALGQGCGSQPEPLPEIKKPIPAITTVAPIPTLEFRVPEPLPFPCFTHRGRLQGGLNGISTRLWLVGTKRVLVVDPVYLGEEVEKYFDPTSDDFSVIYGDFEICPKEADVPGQARRVEVVGFEKLVVQNLKDTSRPPFKLSFTWPKDR